MPHKIFIPSVAHTASQATVNAFRSGVDYVVSDFEEGQVITEGSYLIDMHMQAIFTGVNGKENHGTEVKCRKLMAAGRNVYPVRDPFASYLTRRARIETPDPDLAPQAVADWLAMKTAVADFGGRPIRIGLSPAADLRAAFIEFGLFEDLKEFRPWNVTRIKSAAQRAYAQGNWAYIETNLPQAVALFRAQENVLRPWLEGMGYTAMLWWS